MISSKFNMRKQKKKATQKGRRFFQHDVRLKDQENSSNINGQSQLENQYAIVQQKFKPLSFSASGNKKRRKKKKQQQNQNQQHQHPQHLPTNTPQMLVCHCSCAGVAASGNHNKQQSVLLSSLNKNNVQQWQQLFLNSSGVASFHQHQNNFRSFVR